MAERTEALHIASVASASAEMEVAEVVSRDQGKSSIVQVGDGSDDDGRADCADCCSKLAGVVGNLMQMSRRGCGSVQMMICRMLREPP